MDWIRSIRKHWPWAMIPLMGSLLLAAYRYLDVLATGDAEPFSRIFIKEIGGGIGTVLLLAPLVLLNLRAPLFRGHGLRNVPVHVVGVVVYSVLHTSWHWVFRTFWYAVLGYGRYDYGYMPTRYLMEFPLDLITYLIVTVVVIVVERARQDREREVQLVRLEEQLQRNRLAQLQSQLRPHFLFNSLNTVSSVMYEDVAKADGVLQALADILRRMVDQSDALVVPLGEELDLVGSMVEVMEARFGDRLTVVQDVDPGVRDWPVPPLLLQPIVENAIQHAMPEGDGRLVVTVSGRRSGGRLRLEVWDNGPGIGEAPEDGSGGGVGLANTRERLATHYGDAARLHLSDRPDGGLHVLMEVPWTESAR